MIARSRTICIILGGVALALLSGCTSQVDTPPTPQGQGRSICDCFGSNISDRIFFNFDSATVQEGFHETLSRQAHWLNIYPTVTITVEGYADERGTREYNLELGMKRAAAVRRALVSLGVADRRIKIVSYGKDRPAAVGSDEDAWSQNRRAVVVIDNN